MKIVIDNNVVISALLFPGSVPAFAYRKAFSAGTVFYSESTFGELESVLMRPKFDKYVSIENRKLFLNGFGTFAQSVHISRKVQVCRDPEDDKFLELSASIEADYLITGDTDLLTLNTFEKTAIITPGHFAENI